MESPFTVALVDTKDGIFTKAPVVVYALKDSLRIQPLTIVIVRILSNIF